MSTFYTLHKSDPGNGLFVVNSDTTNGPVSSSNPALPPGVVSANTTLTLVGRGVIDYGAPLLQDFVYILENFANSTPPVYPIQGQLWYKNDTNELNVYNGVSWVSPIISGIGIGDLDMNSFRIINLADPINPNDAINLGFADTRYVNSTSDSMSGFLTLNADPTISLHAATKSYVDTSTAAAIAAITPTYVLKAGDTMTGTLTMSGAGTQIILSNLPSIGTHATNKTYVDNAVASVSPSGTYVLKAGDTMTGTLTMSFGDVDVVTGNITVSTGNITLTTGDALIGGNVNVSNGLIVAGTTSLNFASAASLSMTGSIDMGGFLITNVATPGAPTDAANKAYVDSLVFVPSTSNALIINRQVQIGDGSTINFTCSYPFVVSTNRLQLFINGIKQIASFNATSVSNIFPSITTTSDTGLTTSTSYAFSIAVDGASPADLTITTSSTGPVTHADLINLINAELSTMTIAAVAGITEFSVIIITESAGAGSSITIAPPGVGTYLFSSLTGWAGTSSDAVIATYSYKEIGTPLSPAVTITFDIAPANGDVIEFVVMS